MPGVGTAVRLAVLASGTGTNLQAVIDACAAGTINAQVVGVISDRVIITTLPTDPEELGARRIGDVIDASPHLRVAPAASPAAAAEAMVAFGVEAVPVIDAAGRMAGIVTESDVIRWLAR